ncbi:MAG: tetratricopeptide repeat protein [Kofleriaceae bacterium]
MIRIVLVTMLVFAGTAFADAVKDQAKRDVAAGIAAQAAGDYAAAIALYQKAYDAVPHPELQFNLGQAYRLKGDDPEAALACYRRYLAVEPRGRLAAEAARRIAELEPIAAAHAAEQARRADAARATAEAATIAKARADREAAAKPRRVEPRPVARIEPTSPWTTRRKLAVVSGGLGLAMIAAGGVLGHSARGLERDAFDRCPDPATPCTGAAVAQREIDRAGERAVLANVAFGAGATAVIGGAILWWVGRPAERVTITPTVSSSFTGASLCIGF